MDASRTSRPLVLILSNDDDELVELYSFLDRQGYLVATRIHPLDAFKYASEHKPEIVVVGGPLTAAQCKDVIEGIQAVSPRSHVLAVRTEDDAFAFCGLAADSRVTFFREFSRSQDSWAKITEILRRITRTLPLSA